MGAGGSVFQVVSVHSVYTCNSTILFSSCCCSFLLHVVANLIFIVLVCRQLALLSALPKFLKYFCDQKWCTGSSSEKFHLDLRQSFFFIVSKRPNLSSLQNNERLRQSRGIVLAFSTQVRGFKPGQSRRISRAKKSSARLPSEGKESRRSHIVDLRHVKDPEIYVGVEI